ncbi:MAG: thiosulfate oxidation carrier complex protein SoxZ [Bdellovibrio bacteriovorus]
MAAVTEAAGGTNPTDLGGRIRIRARRKDGTTEALVLMPHPMESGFRRGPDGQAVPARYITEVRIEVAGRTVLEATLGPAVSRDPLLSFRFRGGQPGEPIRVSWIDSLGHQRTQEGVIT